ncbi:MAG: hypothetical protein ABWY08_16225 [Comamonas sp.]
MTPDPAALQRSMPGQAEERKQPPSLTGTGLRALAFAALNRSDTLNSAVNWITGGSVNRDTLAQRVLRDVMPMGLGMTLSWTRLAERSATILPLASKILFDNTSDEMPAAIKSLTHELVLGGAEGATGIKAAGMKLATHTLANTLAHTFTEDKFTEKLLATMVHEHSWQPLGAYLDSCLVGMPLKGFAGDLAKNLVQRAVVDRAGLDQSDRPVFRLLAAQANAFLTDGNYRRPLDKYFTEAATSALPDAVEAVAQGVGQVTSELAQTAVKTAEVLVDGYAGVKESLTNQQYTEAAGKAAKTVFNATATVAEGVVTKALPALAGTAAALTGITVKAAIGTVIALTPTVQAATTSLYQGALSEAGRLYDMAAGQPAYRNGFEAYAKDIEQAAQEDALPALPTPDARTSDCQWAEALVKQHHVVQFALPTAAQTGAQPTASLDKALEQGQIDTARKDALVSLSDQLSTAQLAPFGLMGVSHQVAHNVVSGQLSRLAAQSLAPLPLADKTTEAMADALDVSLTKTVDRAGYQLAKTYAAHVGQLSLDFPEGVYSYADASKDQLSGAGNLWWGENISLADRVELRKLYNTCGGNQQLTLEVSRYLDPAMASQALAAPVLAELDPQGTGMLQLGQPQPSGLQLRLTGSTPQYHYQLRREGADVQLTISAAWDIAQYGTDAQALRSPQGAQPSQLTASVTITVPASGAAQHSAPALQCAIRNELQFSAHGQWDQAAAPDALTTPG